MFKPTLIREAPEVPAFALSDVAKELAVKAVKVLGYSGLDDAVVATKRQAEVAKIFAEIGFLPLKREEVEKYQEWFRQKYSDKYTGVSWRAVNIKNYFAPVPEFALSRALELKERLPEAEFYVEYPDIQKHPVRNLRNMQQDPFLYMYYQGEKHYIEVWDEPKFEGRRTV